jgi:hypothetical protein
MLKSFQPKINLKLLTPLSLSCLLLFTPATLAAFKQTNRKPASDYSRSAGKRGCPGEANTTIPLTLLAPQTYVGHTASSRPTFAGFVSTPLKVELRIFELIPNKRPHQIAETVKQDVKQGIFQISFPDAYPNLTVGKTYLWQLSITCRGAKINESAEFTVVEIPSTLKMKLSTTNNRLEKANLYAEEGFWYDALAEALQLVNPIKLGKLGARLVNNLIEYEVARDEREKLDVPKRVEDLQKIAIQEQ